MNNAATKNILISQKMQYNNFKQKIIKNPINKEKSSN